MMARGSKGRKMFKRKPATNRWQKGEAKEKAGPIVEENWRGKKNRARLLDDRVRGVDPPIAGRAIAFSLTVVKAKRHTSPP